MLHALEQFAPLPLQEGFDNAGLQVGLTETEVSGALLCLDVNERIVDEAIALGCNLIVAHHPLIFKKLYRISDENFVQRTIYKAIQNNVAIVAMHTNLDNATGGVNFKIAEKIGLTHLDFFGEKKEVKVKGFDGEDQLVKGASGVVGILETPLSAVDFVTMLKRTFNAECIQCNQLLRREIRRVALCGGSGAFLLKDAIEIGADAFVTGEMHYHDYFAHEQEIQIAVIGHYESEQFTNEIFKSIIEEQCQGVKCYLTKTNTNPIIYL